MKVFLNRKANVIDPLVEEHDHDDDTDDWNVQQIVDDEGDFVGFFVTPMDDEEPKPRRRRRT